MKKRYFIVMFIGSHPNGQATGHMDFTCSDGCFIRRKEATKQISATNESIRDVVITNIIELTEADYQSWIS